MRLTVGQTIQLAGTETSQGGIAPLGVLVVNLDHAANEELLLFGCSSFPVVWLTDGHGKALVSRPLFPLSLLFILGVQMHVVLDCGQVLHGPRLADGEGTICILPSLV